MSEWLVDVAVDAEGLGVLFVAHAQTVGRRGAERILECPAIGVQPDADARASGDRVIGAVYFAGS